MSMNPNFLGYQIIKDQDKEWHTMNELTPITTCVTFMLNDGTLKDGSIVIEMSGAYYYTPGDWLSPSSIKQWKFR